MDLKKIKLKLQKYFEGQSSEQDEQELRNYFSAGDVADELKPYCNFFDGINGLSDNRNKELEEDIMDFILENELHEKIRYRWLWQTVTGVAAVLLIVLLAINFNQNQWEDTYSDPNQAYAKASKTLQYIAGKYQKGLAQLQPVQKVSTAQESLNNGLAILQKGFWKIEKINEKLKNNSHEKDRISNSFIDPIDRDSSKKPN